MPRTDTHSRIVGWLKVSLPLAALALLSTLFLLSDRIDPEDAIPYAQVDVDDLVRDPRMTAPAYAGTTEDGTAITVTAESARPATGERSAGASGIRATLTMPDGGSSEISAAEADIDDAAGELRLSGRVTVATSTGYMVETESLTALLDRSHAESGGPVAATGPAGKLDAGGFSILRQEPSVGAGGTYLLVFTGGVKLVYQPGG